MRHVIYLLGLVVLCSLSISAAAPATQPAGGPTVLVLPFSASGGNNQWVGKAVQQDLMTELSQGTTARVLAPSSAFPAIDAQAARAAAREQDASIVVFGQAQTIGSQVRLTGQVLDAGSGRALANLKATGPSDDLFHMEDALAGQTLAGLPQTMLSVQALAAERQAAQQSRPAAVQQTAPATTDAASGYNSAAGSDYYSPPAGSSYDYYSPAPATTYNYYYESAPYGYPYCVPAYSYACPNWYWPFWGGFGFVVIGDFDDFHHHGFDHHGFDHHWNNGVNGHGELRNGAAVGSRPGNTFARGAEVGGTRSFAGRSDFAAGSLPRGSMQIAPSARGSMGGPRIYSPMGSEGFRSVPRAGGFGAARFGGSTFHGGSFGGFHGGSVGGFHGGGGFGGGFHGGGFGAAAGHAGGAGAHR